MMDTISFMSWLPDDYSITALQESFPYYAKNGQKSQCWTAIYPLDKSYPVFEQFVREL